MRWKRPLSPSNAVEAFLEPVRLALQRQRAGKAGLLSIVVLCTALVGVSWALYMVDFESGFLAGARLVLVLALFGAVALIIFAWRKPLELLRVSRYLEERNPQLQQRLLTAVEVGRDPAHPLWPLLEKDALRSARSAKTVSPLRAQRRWITAAAVALVAALLTFVSGPPFFRYGLQKLFAFDKSARPLYEISVSPGNGRIAPGMDQEVQARLSGFESAHVTLHFKFANQAQWETAAMERARSGSAFSKLMLDIRETMEYYVEAEKIRSPLYRIDVADSARVRKISLHYFYPAYTGLKPRRFEDTGDIEGLAGTRVRVEVEFNEEPQKPEIFLEGKRETIALIPSANKAFSGEITVRKDDRYWVRTDSPAGETRSSSIYDITALEDRAPVLRFTRPGRDQKVSKLEEVITQLQAEDDYGLHSVQLNYMVNGGKEKSITLFGPGNAREITRDHTFYLEELNVEPGDFVSYYAQGRDAVNLAKTDIYFLEVKPFDREFYQNQQAGAGGGGGQRDEMMLSRRQKDIIAGTWKISQNSKRIADQDGGGRPQERSENFRTLALVQQRLQQQAESIVGRLSRRNVGRDALARQMIESLQEAARLMEPAHQSLSKERASDALTFEQQALQKLLRAEALMKEIQVSWSTGSGGGGGGESRAEELADLFELERDQMKNQYETVQQSQPGQQKDPKVDEALEKLKELARRQQEMQRDYNAARQQRLQQETDEMARQLERLSRQRQNQRLEEAASQLREASRSMQNSMQGQSGAMSGSRALDQLRRAQSQLSNMQNQQQKKQFSQLSQSAENLVRQQQEIEDRVSSMQQQMQRQARVNNRELMGWFNDKQAIREQLKNLEKDLDEAARRTASTQRKASQDLKGAANEIRDRRLADKIEQGTSLFSRGLVDQARQREHSTTQEFRELQSMIEKAEQEAGGAASGDSKNGDSRLQRALEQTGRLLDQLEQMEKQQGQRGQQGQQAGQQGQQDGQQGRQSGQQQGQQDQQAGQQERQTGQQQGERGQQSQRGQQGQQASQQGQQGQQTGQQPGQQGQQGQQGEQGQQSGGNRSSTGSRTAADRQPGRSEGGVTEFSGSFSGPNNGIRPRERLGSDERAWREFWSERIDEARNIRRELSGDRELGRNIDQLLDRMIQLDRQRLLNDMAEISNLRAGIIQGFKALELKMSLRVHGGKEGFHLFNADDVPLEYRKAVEEYYKTLARTGSRKSGAQSP